MRKLAPVFILTSIVALTSASAFAMGDYKKNKDTSSTPAATQGSSMSNSMSGSSYGTQPSTSMPAENGKTNMNGGSTASTGNATLSGSAAGTTGGAAMGGSMGTDSTNAAAGSSYGNSSSGYMMKKDKTSMQDKTPTPMGDTGTAATKAKMSQTAKNDDRCDESKHAGMTLPKECFTKSGTGAAAVNSTQGQSGQ